MKKKKRFQEAEFDERSFERHRQFLLLQEGPVIPWNVPLAEYEYTCIVDGPTGKYPCLFYIKGETYRIKKSRLSHEHVEMCGKIYNSATDLAKTYKHHFTVPLENCKKYLERI